VPPPDWRNPRANPRAELRVKARAARLGSRRRGFAIRGPARSAPRAFENEFELELTFYFRKPAFRAHPRELSLAANLPATKWLGAAARASAAARSSVAPSCPHGYVEQHLAVTRPAAIERRSASEQAHRRLCVAPLSTLALVPARRLAGSADADRCLPSARRRPFGCPAVRCFHRRQRHSFLLVGRQAREPKRCGAGYVARGGLGFCGRLPGVRTTSALAAHTRSDRAGAACAARPQMPRLFPSASG